MSFRNRSAPFSAVLRIILLLSVQQTAWLQASISDTTLLRTTRQSKTMASKSPTTEKTLHGVSTTPTYEERTQTSSGSLQSFPGNVIPTMANKFNEVSITTKYSSLENTHAPQSNNIPAELSVNEEADRQTADESVSHQTNAGNIRALPTAAEVSAMTDDTLVDIKTNTPIVKASVSVSDHVEALADVKSTKVPANTLTTAKHFIQLNLPTTVKPQDAGRGHRTTILNTNGEDTNDCLPDSKNETVDREKTCIDTTDIWNNTNNNRGKHDNSSGSTTTITPSAEYPFRESTTITKEENIILKLSELCPLTSVC